MPKERAHASGCGSSTSTAATSSTTTSGKDMVGRVYRAEGRHLTRRGGGRSSPRCSPRRDCLLGFASGFAPSRRGIRGDLPGGLRLGLRQRAGRRGDSIRRIQLLRLRPILVHVPRHDTRGSCAGLLRRRLPGRQRPVPLARHPAMGERSSDRCGHHAGALVSLWRTP